MVWLAYSVLMASMWGSVGYCVAFADISPGIFAIPAIITYCVRVNGD